MSKNAEIGLCSCISIGSAFTKVLLTQILPMTIALLLAMVLNFSIIVRVGQQGFYTIKWPNNNVGKGYSKFITEAIGQGN